ncbi:MAG: CAP domain-containing protein, partial [Pseudomonadota bacterium]|nr:CAP domain-containing protein [Pseudomonadota bacterium]
YIPYLEDRARRFDGRVLQRSDAPDLVTREGVSAVNEAIGFLKNAAPLPALEPSEGLSKAAADLVEYAGPRGLIGHEGKEGSRVWDRVERYGQWQRTVSENISYGPDEARQIVLGWIIDDGVADRGHRKNLFRDALRVTGTACGPHESYGTMCVATYAGGFRPR